MLKLLCMSMTLLHANICQNNLHEVMILLFPYNFHQYY